jgi:hypothetical protein
MKPARALSRRRFVRAFGLAAAAAPVLAAAWPRPARAAVPGACNKRVINVRDYGAGAGGDDAAAFAVAFSAATSAGVPVFLPAGRYRISAPLPLASGMVLIGGGNTTGTVRLSSARIEGVGTSVIKPKAGAIYQGLYLEDIELATESSGVNVIDLTEGGLAGARFVNCCLTHLATTGCLIRCVDRPFSGNAFDFGLMETSPGRAEPAIHVSTAGPGRGGNVFRDFQWQTNGKPQAPFCLLESTSVSRRLSGYAFDSVWAEVCDAGVLHAFGVTGLMVHEMDAFDAEYTDDVFKVGRNSRGLTSCSAVLHNCRRVGPPPPAGKYTMNLDGAVESVVIGSVIHLQSSPGASDLNLAGNTKVGF